MISRLREQLKIANEDRRTLISELRNRQLSNSNINMNSLNNINLQNQLDNTNLNLQNKSMKLDTKNKILEMTKKNLESYIEKYEKERDNNRKLQMQLATLKGQEGKIEQYKNLIEDLKI